MSKAPRDRYESAREMRAALRAAVTEGTLAAGPVLTPNWSHSGTAFLDRVNATAIARRNRFPMFVGLALAIVLIAGLAIRTRRPPSRGSIPGGTASTGALTPSPTAVPTAALTPVPIPPLAVTSTSPPSPKPVAPAPPEEWPSGSRGEIPNVRRTANPALGLRSTRTSPLRPSGAPGCESSARQRHAAGSPEAGGCSAGPRADGSRSIDVRGPDAPDAGPTSAPPAASQPKVDIDRASVSIAAVTTTSAVPGSNVRAAISRAPVLACYRSALRDRGTGASGRATLHLNLDSAGYVTAAALLNAQFLPAMAGCVERAARGVKIKDVDTGEASADVTLTFVSVP